MRGIATYVGPSGHTKKQPVLDWMNPPQTIDVCGEELRLVLCIHEDTHPMLAAMTDEIADAVTFAADRERGKQAAHRADARRRDWNGRHYGRAS
jgi:hypothetical protein